METDKKLNTIEEELKLLKGELKQSLASVRDYLLNMELPSSEFATVLAALDSGGGQKMTMQGNLTSDKPRAAEPEEEEEPVLEETQEELLEPEEPDLPEEELKSEEPAEDEVVPPEDLMADREEDFGPGEEISPETGLDDELLTPGSGLPAEEEPQMCSLNAEPGHSNPRVNLLANLMYWVTKARKEIGVEQLPLFLEIYSISGHLSPELRDVILHMANVNSDKTEDESMTRIWSQSMLSLHGILTGGDAPLHPVKPFWHEEEAEPVEDEVIEIEKDKTEEIPFKLKLVLPNKEGEPKEYFLDLKPEVDDNGQTQAPGANEKVKRSVEKGEAAWQKKPTRKRK